MHCYSHETLHQMPQSTIKKIVDTPTTKIIQLVSPKVPPKTINGVN